MIKRLYTVLAFQGLVLWIPMIWGQSLTIGSIEGVSGASVEVPVILSVSEDLVGLHLRMVFDPEVFLSPRVEKGPLLNENHLLEYASPRDGELNVVAYSPEGVPPFNGRSGTVLRIEMTLSEFAPSGAHTIGFATPEVGPLTLPPTGLAGAGGSPIAHSSTAGSVRIEGFLDGDLDGNQYLDGLDLFLFCHWWRVPPDPSNTAANMIKTPPNDLIEARDLLRLLEIWK